MHRDSRAELPGGVGRVFPALWAFSSARMICLSVSNAAAQPTFDQGRGEVWAQVRAKLAAQGSAGSATADSVCPRFPLGSVVSAPAELERQNGVLELTMQFLTVVDQQGLTRYCYVTSTGLEAPTLRVNPGDQLIIHFQKMLPATVSSSTSDSMAGMNMKKTLASDPNSITGTGEVSLTVNPTPAHPVSSQFHGTPLRLAGSGAARLACLLLIAFPRRRRWFRATLALASAAVLVTSIGCGNVQKTDPGTAQGTYSVTVPGTAGTGSAQWQTSANIPITIQ